MKTVWLARVLLLTYTLEFVRGRVLRGKKIFLYGVAGCGDCVDSAYVLN